MFSLRPSSYKYYLKLASLPIASHFPVKPNLFRFVYLHNLRILDNNLDIAISDTPYRF